MNTDNLSPLDRTNAEQMTTDALKAQLERDLHAANNYREATDLKEANIFTAIAVLKARGETVDSLLAE